MRSARELGRQVRCLIPLLCMGMVGAATASAQATLRGGSGGDEAYAVAVDRDGCVYVTGRTTSGDLTTRSAFQPELGGRDDAFVMKLSPDGVAVFCTYLGGSGRDAGLDLDVGRGEVVVTGWTDSADFPTRNAAQGKLGGALDAFAVRLGPAGELRSATYLGGGGVDRGAGIVIADDGVYLTGETASGNFPVVAALQGEAGGSVDAFVAKLAPDGHLEFATYLGGSGWDRGTGIAVDEEGMAYVTGDTGGGFPIVRALQSSFGGGWSDAFLAGLSRDGAELRFSTYLGGSDWDFGTDTEVEGGHLWLTGYTLSGDFPLVRPVQPHLGGNEDAFVARVALDGGSLERSTYFGGNDLEFPWGLDVGGDGSVFVVGHTVSSDLPCTRPIQPRRGGSSDAFVLQLSPGGTSVARSSYLGGAGPDEAFDVAVDRGGTATVVGRTMSDPFPAAGATGARGEDDLFLYRVDATGP